MYCSKCGKEIKDGFLFCDNCGTKVEIPEPPKTEEETIETTQEVVEEIAPKKEGVSEDRLDYIMSLLDEKEEKTEEVIEEKVEEKVEETKQEVTQDRLDEILGMLDEKEEPKIEESKAEEPIVEETIEIQEPVAQEPTPVVEPQPVQETIIQEPVNTTTIPESNRVVTEVVSKPVTSKVEETKATETKNDSPLGLISMIIGIVCIPLAFFVKLWTIPVAIAGIIVGACHKGKDGKKTAGIALSAASIPLAVIIAIVAGIFGLVGGFFDLATNVAKEEIESQLDTTTFQADGYTLEYSYKWRSVELEKSNDETGNALEYMYGNDFLAPLGISSLSESETGLDFDASTKDGRDTLYEYFSEYWTEEGKTYGKVVKENTKFKKLKDDIYYATFTYGKDEDTVRGHYILIVSKDANAIISMQTNCSTKDPDDFMDEVEILLETIEIEKQDNIIVDEELAQALDSMSAWNMYSSARKGETIGTKIKLEGAWKELSEDSMGWTFKDGKFWYYKDYDVTDDNYWYGTYEVYTGQDGIDKVGAASTAKDIVNRSSGTVTLDSIYGVVLKPTKIIMDGEDKTSEKITGEEEWKYAWILVNHGEEGIEGQIANMNTGSVYYFFKTQD